MKFNTRIRINKIFCWHEWKNYVYNIRVYDYSDNPPLVTICFKVCKKCAKSKWVFVFGNE